MGTCMMVHFTGQTEELTTGFEKSENRFTPEALI